MYEGGGGGGGGGHVFLSDQEVLETGGFKVKGWLSNKLTLTPIGKRERKQRFCRESMKKRY